MIIAFYPGAGGNRWYLSYTGQKDFVPGQTYDRRLEQEFRYRYLDSTTIGLPDQPLILTHCMNVPLLRQHFPAHDCIVVILADLDRCLRREWTLEDQHRDKDMPPDEHARSHISYHHRYYQEYPVDTSGATQIIDIDSDSTEFAQMMRKELSSIQSGIFDTALADHKKIKRDIDKDQLPGDHAVNSYKSKFLDDAEKMKQRLDQISPSMCLAKWKQVSLHLTTGMNNSCYHPPLHQISIDEIKRDPGALHNTKHKKEQRRLMLNGLRPAECQYCWNMEDLGKLSDRHYRSGEPWAAIDFGKIVSSEWDSDDVVPSYVEVNFNHACNLRCSYCSPQFSSSWMDEIQRHGAYPTSTPHNAPEHFEGTRRTIPVREENPYVDAFWQWWPTLYPHLKHFRMTGGEPLMDRNTYRVFDYVLALPKPDLHLNVTSNFSVESKLWDKYLDYTKRLCDTNIEHFMQYVSIDSGHHAHAEYIRHGLDADLCFSRVARWLDHIPYRNSLTFIITMNNLSVLGLQKLLEIVLELRRAHSSTYQRVWFDTPVLRQPAWQSLQILPASYAGVLERTADWMELNLVTADNPYWGFKDFEVQRLRRDIAWMRQGQSLPEDQLHRDRADFYRFFAEHDRRRGSDFLETFPEMRQWWEECRGHAQRG